MNFSCCGGGIVNKFWIGVAGVSARYVFALYVSARDERSLAVQLRFISNV